MSARLSPEAVARARREALRALPEESAWAEPLRARYLAEIERTGVGFTDNLKNPYAWSVYVYYTGLLQRILPDRRARIVDWGGLYGHVTALLRARGYADTSNYLLFTPPRYEDFERAFQLPTLYGKEPNTLALPDASVDCFISSGVLEHVREDGVGREEAVLREVRRVLKPGGVLAIWHLPTTLAAADLWGQLRGKWYHQYRYRERQVRDLIAEAGLELVHLERHGGSVPGTALRLARASPAKALRRDVQWGSVPVARLTAQNFALVAQRSTDA